jgi:hypothetical protein
MGLPVIEMRKIREVGWKGVQDFPLNTGYVADGGQQLMKKSGIQGRGLSYKRNKMGKDLISRDFLQPDTAKELWRAN